MSGLRGLVVDWGGVLTSSLDDSMTAWAAADDVEMAEFRAVLADWLGEPWSSEARVNPVHALERGELEVPHFEEQLVARLRTRSGRPLVADGLLARMFDCFEHAPDMAGVVRRARQAGVRTALLSNSWGNTYPRDGWEDLFDTVVISGEVGLRKPDAGIFALVLDRLGLEPHQCVFVDDLPRNVQAAVELGFVGVRHTSYEETVGELEVLFGRRLRHESA